MRLKTTGAIDDQFDPVFGIAGSDPVSVNAIQIQANSQMIVGGNFETVNGIPKAHLARLGMDGSTDYFVFAGGELSNVNGLLIQPDGGIVLSGSLTTDKGVLNIGRLFGGDDSHPGSISFGNTEVIYATPGDSVSFQVYRSGGIDNDVSVNYATEDFGAIEGIDYNACSGTLIWKAGDSTPKTIQVQLRDGIAQGDKMFHINLGQTVGGVFIGLPDSVAIAIVNADQFGLNVNASPRHITAAQNELGMFELSLSHSFNRDITVNYSVSGDAIPGLDYKTLKGYKRIMAGDIISNVIIKPLHPEGATGTKTIVLTVEQGEGYVAGESKSAKIKIK